MNLQANTGIFLRIAEALSDLSEAESREEIEQGQLLLSQAIAAQRFLDTGDVEHIEPGALAIRDYIHPLAPGGIERLHAITTAALNNTLTNPYDREELLTFFHQLAIRLIADANPHSCYG